MVIESCSAASGQDGVSAAVRDLLLVTMKFFNGKRDHMGLSGRIGRAREGLDGHCVLSSYIWI